MEKFARVSSVNREANVPEKIIELAEDNYSAYIDEAAEMILSSGKPVVLLSGPSGSGKTTAALRIEARLRELGRTAHTLSMDNYFLPISDENRHELPRDEEGNIDLESPMRLDIPLFTKHLKKIAACEEFEMPRFNFAAQSRREPVPFLRKHGEIIIIEGIHALNPDVTGNDEGFALHMYVSVRTYLKAADGSLMHPAQIRLMRRLCRDSLFRKRSYADIFRMFGSVSRGEKLYITPYKKRSDYDIDTFMAYEASVYKNFLYDNILAQAHDELADFPCCAQILQFLGELNAIDPKYVPSASMIREFIGGSELKY